MKLLTMGSGVSGVSLKEHRSVDSIPEPRRLTLPTRERLYTLCYGDSGRESFEDSQYCTKARLLYEALRSDEIFLKTAKDARQQDHVSVGYSWYYFLSREGESFGKRFHFAPSSTDF